MSADFILSSDASISLRDLGFSITVNPYDDYFLFRMEVLQGISSIHEEFRQVCDEIKFKRNSELSKAFLIRNLPIDKDIAAFNAVDPVSDKYRIKKKFVGESVLEALAILTDTPILAYHTRNNGDFFQDVYPQSKYSETQTQKTDGELAYHNDRTAHPVRPDYLALLGMRTISSNLIYTGFVDSRDILKSLSNQTLSVLSEPLFETPFDDFSRDSNPEHIKSKPHAIFYDFDKLRYHECRTVPLKNSSANTYEAYIEFRNALAFAKQKRVQILDGDLFTFPNQSALHNREIVNIADPILAKQRWLLKTYNFRSSDYAESFQGAFLDGKHGLVNDHITREDFEV